MPISALEGRNVALWGFGREGRAALSALRRRFPSQRFTVLCPAAEAPEVAALADPLLTLETDADAARIAAFDIVIRSPGISPLSSLSRDAAALGARFSSGTALWFDEALPGLKLCVTGTKGKSTTTALVAHLLRRRGLAVGLAGNIGLPLIELVDPPMAPAVWAIELSSYQTTQAGHADVALVLNLFPEHLDWHGDAERYFSDKLALVERSSPRRVVLDADDGRLRAFGARRSDVLWFNRADGWHLRGDRVWRGDEEVFDAARMPLPGRHNRSNLCAALAAIEALGFDARPLAVHAATFHALPHRLQSLGVRDGIEYVDDSISTTPHASIAALDCFAGQPVAILVGGYDRGIDWTVFAERIATAPPLAVVGMGQNGRRILDRIRTAVPPGTTMAFADDLVQAVAVARTALKEHPTPARGVLLLSPGAPSFPLFRDYSERGRAFAEAAGFDSAAAAISGLGIA
jgi:UDP-N-acetylmuramoyl-L-alanine---L-glutamate ligase